MSSRPALPQVERLFRDGTVSGLSEAALLDRFLEHRDELAFEALVDRHGPLVLGVCRRVLHDPSDVDDAFQATFLVLVRKARSIGRRDALGPWLYGVAYRIARRSRGVRIRQRQRECPLPDLEPSDESIEPAWRDLRAVLDEELARLPDRYRRPLVLCYLQGLTHDEAAGRLGCPVGTVRSRLARGRERLGVRLVRRGLAPAAGLIGASLATKAGGGVVPPALTAATVHAAGQIAQGCAVASVASVGSTALLDGMVGTMGWKTLAKAAAMLTVIGILVAGAFFAGRRREPPMAVADPYDIRIPKAVQRPALTPYPEYVVEPPDLLIVEVLDALPARPIQGEHLVRPDGTITLGFYGDVYVAGLTLSAVKEKIVLHLRKYLTDDALGLWRGGSGETDRAEAQRLLALDYFRQLNPPLSHLDEPAEPVPAPQPASKSAPRPAPTPPPAPPPPPPPLPPRPGAASNKLDSAAEHKPVVGAPPAAPATQPAPDRKGVFDPDAAPQPIHADVDAEQAPASGMVYVAVHPKDSDSVYVDIGSYNSKFYYVLGMTRDNGRFPCTGRETVLDAIENAGGLLWYAAPEKIRLVRPGKGNEADHVLPIDYAAIAYGVDPSTNYQMFPGDRVVIPSDSRKIAAAEKARSSSATVTESPDVARRIVRLEEKLDALLEALGKPARNPGADRPKRAKDVPGLDEAAERNEAPPPEREKRDYRHVGEAAKVESFRLKQY